MASLQLKFNTRVYSGNTADFTTDKNKIFDENVLLYNTQTNVMYIGDGKTKLQSLTPINVSASEGVLGDYLKIADIPTELEDYLSVGTWGADVATISTANVLYKGTDKLYIGDGTTAIKDLNKYIEIKTVE